MYAICQPISWRFGSYGPWMTEKLHFVRIYGKPGFAVISDSFISCWICVSHFIVFIHVTNCFVGYFPKEWNMFSNYLPILSSHGRIGFWETNNYFILFFFPKKDNVLRNSTPSISLRRKIYVIICGSIASEQEGSKGGAAQKWGPKPFYFLFCPNKNHVITQIYLFLALTSAII